MRLIASLPIAAEAEKSNPSSCLTLGESRLLPRLRRASRLLPWRAIHFHAERASISGGALHGAAAIAAAASVAHSGRPFAGAPRAHPGSAANGEKVRRRR